MLSIVSSHLDLSSGDIFSPINFPISAGISLVSAGSLGRGEQPNRTRFFKKMKIRPESVWGLKQVHSREVFVVDRLQEKELEGDGLITKDPEMVLTVTVADCFPIFLFDSESHAYGVLHSGTRGTGIVKNAIDMMTERFGTKVEDLWISLGPGIGPCCYRVNEERAASFAEQWGENCVVERADGWYLDLAQANFSILERKGVRRLFHIRDCSRCSPYLGSYRGEGKDNFTSMLACIGDFARRSF